MHKIVSCVLFLTVAALAQNHLEIIYPENDQQIAAVDSTFIFGNTNPKAKLLINGEEIKVHKDGGFLAFLPVDRGAFKFNIISDLESDICATTVNIQIGPIKDDSEKYVRHSSITPAGRTVLLTDGAFEFSLKAKTAGQVYCSFIDGVWRPMYPGLRPESVEYYETSAGDADFITFAVKLQVNDIIDSSRVYYLYEEDYFDSNGVYLCSEFEIDSTDFYIVRTDDYPSRVLRLTGRPHIIRTAPGKGYKLVNQPAGVKFIYAGESQDCYRVKLTDDITGYVRKSDARLEPLGTAIPKGEVSRIAVDDFPKYVQISMKIEDQLPYEIHTDGSLMTVDIYGLNSDTDWIRFNGSQDYIKSLWWTQPQDGVYRLNIHWYDNHFWGYNCFYEGKGFVLRLKKRLYQKRFFRSPVEGLKIVIDPGHSHDAGAKGPTGLKEKDANLWIAHELRQILMSKGAEVLMTRMGHEHLEVYDRVDIATKWDADLLISIHNNAVPDGVNPFVHNGSSVYYYFDQARPLAEAIHKHLLKATKLPDHGLYYGNLALCRVTDCPAVLVECAFMMIPEQEAMLKTDKFQRKCAKAIYKGICDYLRE